MKTMLKLYALGATGVFQGELSDFDFRKVMQYASEQGVWMAVFSGIKQAIRENRLEICENDKELFDKFSKQLIISCLNNEKKHKQFDAIIEKLENNGIKTCVLKGRTLATLYKNPECRTSGDVDLLVSENDEAKALNILRQEGFNIKVRAKSSNHSECFHETLGALELHVSLYYSIMQDVWFDNQKMITEPFIKAGGVTSLGITDGYIYTLLHAVKHFLSNGLCVKQIMDVLLYEMTHLNEIDFERVDKLLTHLKYKTFYQSLKGFGVEYFGFSPSNFHPFTYEKEMAEKILSDVTNGGMFGKKAEREDFFEIYNAYRFSRFKNENFSKFMTNWRRTNVKKAMSFSKENIEIRYPFVLNKPYLLPLAWIKHIFVIIKTGLKRFKLVRQSVAYKAPTDDAEISERIELFKFFDMI